MIPYPLELFQSTLSLRRATPGGWAGWVHGLISIHALLAESDGEPAGGGGHHGISIHALLAESDQAFLPLISSSRYFNPRSPCGERPGDQGEIPKSILISIHALLAESDPGIVSTPSITARFQSTLSLRRATQTVTVSGVSATISIHALLAESDLGWRRLGSRF